MRNPAVEPPAEDDALDAAEQPIERRRDDAADGEVAREGLHSPTGSEETMPMAEMLLDDTRTSLMADRSKARKHRQKQSNVKE